MDALERAALGREVMTYAELREAYGAGSECSPYARRLVRRLCESHERLRGELEGTQLLEADSRRTAERLSAELLRAQDRAADLRARLWRVAEALEAFEGEHLRKALTLSMVVAIRRELKEGVTDGTA